MRESVPLAGSRDGEPAHSGGSEKRTEASDEGEGGVHILGVGA